MSHAWRAVAWSALGMVETDASLAERRTFAAQHMRPHVAEGSVTSEDVAYEILVAWMEQ